MIKRTLVAAVVVSLVSMQCLPIAALADNQMGYQLLTADQASALPRKSGKLGMEVGRAQQVTSGGMTFDILRVKRVASGSAGAQAGFKAGDQIIAVDGRVFPSVEAFAAYVGSMAPARQLSVDYIPSNGGPQEAQRVNVTMGGAQSVTSPQIQAEPKGLSTTSKVAIGVGAAALFGCYKFGCFSHKAMPNNQVHP